MWECGKSGKSVEREISEMAGVSVSTVNRLIRRWQEEGSVKTKPRSGRPRVTTHEGVNHMLDSIQERPMLNAVKLTHDLQLPCHPRTTR